MKKLVSLLVSLFFVISMGWAFAQGNDASLPSVQKVKHHIKQQEDQIAQGLQSKIIKKSEAKVYRAKLKTVKTKLQRYLKKNHNKDLTTDQQKELFELLHENNEALNNGGSSADDKDPDAAPAAK